MDAMLLFSPLNWRYYGGWTDVAQMHNWVWRSCMIVPRDHDPVLVAHGAFFWQTSLTTHIDDCRFWIETELGKGKIITSHPYCVCLITPELFLISFYIHYKGLFPIFS
ncbi:hypothetical protein ES703_55397 [subsurface metagenome]